MRILIVAPWVPSKVRPRSRALISGIGERYETMLVAACWSDQDQSDLQELDVPAVPVRLSKPGALARVLGGLLTGKSLQQSYLNSKTFHRAVEAAVSEFEPDLVYFNVLRSAQAAYGIEGVPKVIDLDEYRSDYYRQMSIRTRNPLWKLIARVEYRRMRKAERVVVEEFDHILVSSPADLRQAPDKTTLVRSPHSLTARPQDDVAPRPGSVVFVGRMSYRANFEAIERFVRRSMPELRKRNPGAVLSVVGEAPGRRLRRLQSESVQVLGRVDDVEPHYRSAMVTLAPITMATGVQMKVIEALSLGIPTIVSRVVAEGAGLTDGVDCLIADDDRDWAIAVDELLRDRRLREQLSAAGADWARRHYDRTSIVQTLYEVLDSFDRDRRVESRISGE